MPSPIGHALAGIASGVLVSRANGRRSVLLFSALGIAADLDFLLPLPHRGPSHSIGAALLVFAAAFAWRRFTARRSPDSGDGWVGRPLLWSDGVAVGALAIAAAYASHTLLDWLGEDHWPPLGIMALWPFSSDFYVSGLEVFSRIERRYWLPDFWQGNAVSIVREIAILGPLTWLIVSARRRAAPDRQRLP